jgi:hypothetical protein
MCAGSVNPAIKYDKLVNKLIDAVQMYVYRLRNGLPNISRADATLLESMLVDMQTGNYTTADVDLYTEMTDALLGEMRRLPDQPPDSPLTRAMLMANVQARRSPVSPISLSSRTSSTRNSPIFPQIPLHAMRTESPPSDLFSNTSRSLSFSSI